MAPAPPNQRNSLAGGSSAGARNSPSQEADGETSLIFPCSETGYVSSVTRLPIKVITSAASRLSSKVLTAASSTRRLERKTKPRLDAAACTRSSSAEFEKRG